MANEKKHGFGQNSQPEKKHASQGQQDKSMKHEKNEKYGKNCDANCKCCDCDKENCKK